MQQVSVRFLPSTYYLAESFSWYSLAREKLSCIPRSFHKFFMASKSSSVKGSVSSILLIISNTRAASVYNTKRTSNQMTRWCNGLARLQQWLCYLQGPGFESHLRPVEFFSCNKVSPLNNRIPTPTSVPCAPIIRGHKGLHKKQPNKKKDYQIN